MARPLVTLTTDFGSAYAAQVRAVLARADPELRLIDLEVELAPHQIPEAAFLFEHMAVGFPPGTIHLAVVDPGVGGRRAPIAVRTRDGSTLIGPENGLLDRLALRLGVASAVRLDRRRLARRPRIGTTFDGRDLFAPAAAAVAGGTPLAGLGASHRYRPAPPRAPTRGPTGACGRILHIDRFGNLITDLPSPWLPGRPGRVELRIAGGAWRTVRRVVRYGAIRPDGFGVLRSSFGTLEVAAREARAGDRLTAHVGAAIELAWARPGTPRGKRKYRARVR